MTQEIIQKKQLSEKALENLKRNEELRNAGSKFVKLAAGEKITLIFDPENIRTVEVEFEGKKQTKIEYTVIDPSTQNVRYLTVSKRASASIDLLLSQGTNKMTIQRVGSGTDTNYMVFPA